MSNLTLLKTPTSGRIVEVLEELVAQAKEGKVTGLFIFSESIEGQVTHSRDGMSDSLIIFWLELIKRRILGAYEPEGPR